MRIGRVENRQPPSQSLASGKRTKKMTIHNLSDSTIQKHSRIFKVNRSTSPLRGKRKVVFVEINYLNYLNSKI